MTAQVGDRLVYNGEQMPLFANPLEAYFKKGHARPKPEGRTVVCSTDNWRGYIAFWLIENDILYLTDIKGSEGESSKAMNKLFPCGASKIKADWFSGSLRVPRGKVLRYVHMGYDSAYEQDLIISVVDGEVVGEELIDNRRHQSRGERLWCAVVGWIRH